MPSILRLVIAATTMLIVTAGCSPQPSSKASDDAGPDAMFEVDELLVVANDGSRHTLDVYLALDYEQQRRGLMFVRELPDTTGMLFVYEDAGMRSMWMKNTYISLDIVFARADGTVSSVIHDTEPLSERSLSAIEPVNYVLELNAGVARRLKIAAGSQLVWQR